VGAGIGPAGTGGGCRDRPTGRSARRSRRDGGSGLRRRVVVARRGPHQRSGAHGTPDGHRRGRLRPTPASTTPLPTPSAGPSANDRPAGLPPATTPSGTGTLPTYGAFTLLRAAVENFGSTMWLLSGHDRTQRVRRELYFQAANQKALAQAGELAAQAAQQAGQTITSKEDRLQAVLRVAARNGLTMEEVKAGRSCKSVVRTLGLDEATSDIAEYLCKTCGAFAHGDQWPSITFLDQEEMPTSDERVVHLRLTVSFSNLTPMLELTVAMAQLVLRTFDRLRLPAEGRASGL
jgi:hypothetical protein